MDYEVIWNGTRASACGSPYLAADAAPLLPAPELKVRKPAGRALTALMLDWIESFGPSTIREIADGLEVEMFKVNASICNLKKRGAVVVVDQRRVVVRKFGVRLVAVYGVPA